MKWYFASRVRHKEKMILISRFLDEKGEKLVSNWIYEASLKPYHKNIESVQRMASQVISSIMSTDIFVLVSDPEGTDMFIELGACLARISTSSKIPRIYIIGEHSKRSLMQLHPSINHLKNMKEVFKRENIDCGTFAVPDFG
jgi:hypothetical protein